MARLPPMTPEERAEALRWVPRTDDPEIRARRQHVLQVLLDMYPELREGVQEEKLYEGWLHGARAALRQVFARRGLALSAEEDARIEACADLATLERWHDEAILAPSAADALR